MSPYKQYPPWAKSVVRSWKLWCKKDKWSNLCESKQKLFAQLRNTKQQELLAVHLLYKIAIDHQNTFSSTMSSAIAKLCPSWLVQPSQAELSLALSLIISSSHAYHSWSFVYNFWSICIINYPGFILPHPCVPVYTIPESGFTLPHSCVYHSWSGVYPSVIKRALMVAMDTDLKIQGYKFEQSIYDIFIAKFAFNSEQVLEQ